MVDSGGGGNGTLLQIERLVDMPLIIHEAMQGVKVKHPQKIHKQILKDFVQSYHKDMGVKDLCLGENLLRLRTARGLTQDQLEERSGVSQASISRCEKGLQPNMELQSVVALANALRCSLFDLLSDRKLQNFIDALNEYFGSEDHPL